MRLAVAAKLSQLDIGKRPVGPASQPVCECLLRWPEQQVPGVGYTSADDKAAGIEYRRQIRQAFTKPAPYDVEASPCSRVALQGGPGHLRPGDALRHAAAQLQQPDRGTW